MSKRKYDEVKQEDTKTDNEDLCSLCYETGDLILCDHCPRSYHLACAQLDKIPSISEWVCPTCVSLDRYIHKYLTSLDDNVIKKALMENDKKRRVIDGARSKALSFRDLSRKCRELLLTALDQQESVEKTVAGKKVTMYTSPNELS